MKSIALHLLTLCCAAVALLHPTAAEAKDKPVLVVFPAHVSHEAWDRLLKKYVNEKGLVAYEKWKANAADRQALHTYLEQFGVAGSRAEGNDLQASAINAYNAFAIEWILQNYPTESIQALDNSFARKEHLVSGTKIALDDIEHGTLRPTLGYRTHAALVCCARSCPPLQRNAYTEAGVDEQITTAYTTWLAREDLNQYHPDKNEVAISSIFKWFSQDFQVAGGVPKILGQYGPPAQRPFLAKGAYKIDYLPYRWGLNDQGSHGEKYSTSNLIFDHLF